MLPNRARDINAKAITQTMHIKSSHQPHWSLHRPNRPIHSVILLLPGIKPRRREPIRPSPHIGPIPLKRHRHLPEILWYERLLKRADIEAFAGILLAIQIVILKSLHATVRTVRD